MFMISDVVVKTKNNFFELRYLLDILYQNSTIAHRMDLGQTLFYKDIIILLWFFRHLIVDFNII